LKNALGEQKLVELLEKHGNKEAENFIVDEANSFESRLSKQKECLLQVKTELGTPELLRLFKKQQEEGKQRWVEWIQKSNGKYIAGTAIL
jgi:hypothetical protein